MRCRPVVVVGMCVAADESSIQDLRATREKGELGSLSGGFSISSCIGAFDAVVAFPCYSPQEFCVHTPLASGFVSPAPRGRRPDSGSVAHTDQIKKKKCLLTTKVPAVNTTIIEKHKALTMSLRKAQLDIS